MKIQDILTNNYLKNQKAKQKKLKEEAAEGTSAASKTDKIMGSDRTQISEKARELQQSAQLIQTSVEILKQLPSIREDAVALARERMNSGFYNQPEVTDTVAKIIGEHLSANSPLSASDLATDVIANISPDQAELTKTDLLNIRKSLEKGMTQNSDIITKVADRIYQFLNSINSQE